MQQEKKCVIYGFRPSEGIHFQISLTDAYNGLQTCDLRDPNPKYLQIGIPKAVISSNKNTISFIAFRVN